MEEVIDRDDHLQRVENMAKSVSSSRASTADGKPKRDRRTMLGRFRRPRPSSTPQEAGNGDGGVGTPGGLTGGGGETNVALANYITNKKEKKVSFNDDFP